MRLIVRLALLAGLLGESAAPAAEPDYAAGDPVLIQEIDCARPGDDVRFTQYPAGASTVEELLGTTCRVLPNTTGDARYFAYRLGEGRGLKPGAAYRLTIDYPEDRSRALYICNWGNETALGFATGRASGDVIKSKYVANNPESLAYPLSGRIETWSQLFYLHDRFPDLKRPRSTGLRPLTPADGFWVVIARPAAWLDPLSAGAAVAKIRLHEIRRPEALALKINYPPAGLPRRHIFSREEMADGVVAMGHKPEERDETLRGVKDPADWYDYKMRVMRFLGQNVFTKDLLEFGHNQGWDSSAGGGNRWFYQAPNPDLWSRVLARAAKHDLAVLPYYEYRGSLGGDPALALGTQHRCRRLDGGETYTHIKWCEGRNADLVDPDTLADAKRLLDVTLSPCRDRVKFIGAWFRQRPTALPVSFNELDLAAFSAEANSGAAVARADLPANKALLDRYYAWWFGRRRAFWENLAAHLRATINPDAFVLYTNDASEPGRSLPSSITGAGRKDPWKWKQVLVTDDLPAWEKILSADDRYQYLKPSPFADVIGQDMHRRALETFAENWGGWELNHSTPPNDPATYSNSSDVMLSYSYNRLYTVGSPRTFSAYRNPAGLALVRHYSLNENEMSVGKDELLGYFMCDVERAGPFCMMAEARALAYGDPTHLGSLTGNSNQRGFPGYVRAFHAAFLALPALPGEAVPSAATDPEVFVRRIRTERHGDYFSVVNTGFTIKSDVPITLPVVGKTRDAARDSPLTARDGKLRLTLHPGELRALHVARH